MLTRNLAFEASLDADSRNNIFSQIQNETETIGYYSLPDSSYLNVALINSFVKSLHKKIDIKNLIVIGIGGSSLGLRAIDEALKNTKHRLDINLVLLEHLDPVKTNELLKNVKLKDSFICVISKSGSTIETTSLFKFLLSFFKIELENKKTFQKRFAFITDEGSPLDVLAQKCSASVFYLPSNVGGRFSVLSSVGLVPLAILGYDIYKLLDGANTMKEEFFEQAGTEIATKANFYALNASQRPINTLFIYSSELAYLGAWYVQLWAESLGKIDRNGNNVGLTPTSMVGSIDQHSFLQLIVQGSRDKTVTFIKLKKYAKDFTVPDMSINGLESTNYANGQKFSTILNAQCDATMETLMEQGVPCDMIELEKLDEQNIGALIFYFELLTSCAARVLNVNCYDQPGVEFGKKKLSAKFSK